jgi:hypothetical protein
MEIVITRDPNASGTPGTLTINDVFECFTLEDVDRGLKQTMTMSEIVKNKIHGQTAIPAGRYELVVSFSERFRKLLPLAQNVPGFIGIRIHPGNSTGDTEGCILVGTQLNGNQIVGGTSRPAFNALFSKIQAALKREKIFLTLQ